jgi:hypothetical protein
METINEQTGGYVRTMYATDPDLSVLPVMVEIREITDVIITGNTYSLFTGNGLDASDLTHWLRESRDRIFKKSSYVYRKEIVPGTPGVRQHGTDQEPGNHDPGRQDKHLHL